MTVSTLDPAIYQPKLRPFASLRAVPWMLVLPCALFLIVLFVVPVAQLLVLSVTHPTFSLNNYWRILTAPVYARVLLNTFLMSLYVTIGCLILGYPIAYIISRRADALGRIIFGIVMLSFWSGFIVRTYAWLVILGSSGPLAALFAMVGIKPAPQMLFTSVSSIVGMTQILLPFMIMALYGVMVKIDGTLLRAASSVGARPATAFRDVFLPLSMPGVASGCVLVFTACLGFYITPMLMGSPKDMMISQIIDQQIQEVLDWGFAAALSVFLLLTTFIVLWLYNRYFGLDRTWG